MALQLTNNSSDNINFGKGSGLDNNTTWTFIAWLYLDTYQDWLVIYQKDDGGGKETVELADDSVNGRVGAVVRRTISDADSANCGLVTGKWSYLAITYDSAAASGARFQFYYGDLTNLATNQGQGGSGSGTVSTNDQADWVYGGDPTNCSGNRVAMVQYHNAVLSLADIQQQQYKQSVLSSTQILAHPGWHGATNVPDFSGNANNGTGTGLALVDHVPLGPPFGFDIGVPYMVATGGLSIPIAMHHYTKNIGN